MPAIHSRASLRVALGTLLTLILAVNAASAQFSVGLGQAWSEFHDPSGRFTMSVPPGWVYQADQSTDAFFVFYGTGDYDLFYLEVLEPASAGTAMDQARAAAERYSGPRGLSNFALLQAPYTGQLAGKEASFMVYSYSDSTGVRMVEGRAFVVHGGKVFTLAFADVAERFDASVPTFNGVIQALRLHEPAPAATGFGLGFGATSSATTSAAAPASPAPAAPAPSVTAAPAAPAPSAAASGIYTSPDRRFQLAPPADWDLWEEQSTARGDYIEPWESLFNWPGKPMTKVLFIWDYFDSWRQVGAQYEVVLGVIDDLPGSLSQAVETLKNQITGNLSHIYAAQTGRARIGNQTGLEVRIAARPGMTEPWSAGPLWFKDYTFYTFKQGNAFFVWAVPTEAVDIPAVKSALDSFRWNGQ